MHKFLWVLEMIVVTVKVEWGQETIQEILPELRKHVEITLQEPGCDDFLFAVDVNNPDIVVATEVYKDYPAHEDHFKTAQWGHFSGIMEKYPPRSIDVEPTMRLKQNTLWMINPWPPSAKGLSRRRRKESTRVSQNR